MRSRELHGEREIVQPAAQLLDLVVRLDGLGTTRAAARYTATVTNAGLGTVAIAGGAKCTVTSSAGGPVTCGPQR